MHTLTLKILFWLDQSGQGSGNVFYREAHHRDQSVHATRPRTAAKRVGGAQDEATERQSPQLYLSLCSFLIIKWLHSDQTQDVYKIVLWSLWCDYYNAVCSVVRHGVCQLRWIIKDARWTSRIILEECILPMAVLRFYGHGSMPSVGCAQLIRLLVFVNDIM